MVLPAKGPHPALVRGLCTYEPTTGPCVDNTSKEGKLFDVPAIMLACGYRCSLNDGLHGTV